MPHAVHELRERSMALVQAAVSPPHVVSLNLPPYTRPVLISTIFTNTTTMHYTPAQAINIISGITIVNECCRAGRLVALTQALGKQRRVEGQVGGRWQQEHQVILQNLHHSVHVNISPA